MYILHNQLHFLQKHARHSLIIDRNRSPTQKSTPSFIRYGPGATTVQLELRIISRSCYPSTGRARGGLSVRSSAAARTHTHIHTSIYTCIVQCRRDRGYMAVVRATERERENGRTGRNVCLSAVSPLPNLA